MFTVGPPKPEPKCPLGRVNVLSSGSTPAGSMLLREVCTVRGGARGGGTFHTKFTASSRMVAIPVSVGVLGTPSGPGPLPARPPGETMEGNWLGEPLHPRREGSTTVLPGGFVGDERCCLRAANLLSYVVAKESKQAFWVASISSNWVISDESAFNLIAARSQLLFFLLVSSIASRRVRMAWLVDCIVCSISTSDSIVEAGAGRGTLGGCALVTSS